jgi:hypothetical protein
VLSWSRAAGAVGSAGDKRACADASEEAQLLRIHGKLRAARDKLLICARDACPPLVKHDCEQWLAEVDASISTIVISATDAQGHDVADVHVWVDDEPFLDKLSGVATPIDSGEHVVRFKHADDPPIEQRVIVREGEKNRLLEVHLQPIVALLPAPVSATERPATREAASSPTMTILAYSLLGVGAAAVGVGVYFEITQVNDYATLKNTCSPSNSCKQSDVDTIANDRIYGGVSLGAGVAAAGVGTILLLTRKHAGAPGPAATRTGTWFDVAPTRGGATALVHVSF